MLGERWTPLLFVISSSSFHDPRNVIIRVGYCVGIMSEGGAVNNIGAQEE